MYKGGVMSLQINKHSFNTAAPSSLPGGIADHIKDLQPSSVRVCPFTFSDCTSMRIYINDRKVSAYILIKKVGNEYEFKYRFRNKDYEFTDVYPQLLIAEGEKAQLLMDMEWISNLELKIPIGKFAVIGDTLPHIYITIEGYDVEVTTSHPDSKYIVSRFILFKLPSTTNYARHIRYRAIREVIEKTYLDVLFKIKDRV
jgi:hypothetical protein